MSVYEIFGTLILLNGCEKCWIDTIVHDLWIISLKIKPHSPRAYLSIAPKFSLQLRTTLLPPSQRYKIRNITRWSDHMAETGIVFPTFKSNRI